MCENIVVRVGGSRIGDQALHEVRSVLRNFFGIQVHGDRCQCLTGHQGVGGCVAVEHQIELADLDDVFAGVRTFNINAQGRFFNHPDVTGQGAATIELNRVAVHRLAIVRRGQHQAADRHGFVGACIFGLLDLGGGAIDDGAGAHAGVQAIAEVAHRQHIVVDLANARQNIVGGAQGGAVVGVVNLGHRSREGGGYHGGHGIHQAIARALQGGAAANGVVLNEIVGQARHGVAAAGAVRVGIGAPHLPGLACAGAQTCGACQVGEATGGQNHISRRTADGGAIVDGQGSGVDDLDIAAAVETGGTGALRSQSADAQAGVVVHRDGAHAALAHQG